MARKYGSKNKSTKRAENAARQAAYRERQAEKAEEEAAQEQLFKDMREQGLLFFGETAPLINCINMAEEVQMAQIWARLLGIREITPGENQKAYVLEVLKAWCSAECPLLHLETLTLAQCFMEVPDIDTYLWPEDCPDPVIEPEPVNEKPDKVPAHVKAAFGSLRRSPASLPTPPEAA